MLLRSSGVLLNCVLKTVPELVSRRLPLKWEILVPVYFPDLKHTESQSPLSKDWVSSKEDPAMPLQVYMANISLSFLNRDMSPFARVYVH